MSKDNIMVSFLIAVAVVVCVLLFSVEAKAGYNERHYQDLHCTGFVEFRLNDKSRIDCLTSDYAIEFDFSKKWAEAIGQSLYYSLKTGRSAGIYLILKGTRSAVHLAKLKSTISAYNLPITVFTVDY